MTFLGRWLAAMPHRKLSYRLLFIPGTIGAITWLARNQERLSTIRHGLVLTGLGGPGGLVYKRSRRENAPIDRASVHVLTHRGTDFEVRDFVPYGYDERQYCSPGINLPVGCLSRTPFGEYPEYHTSADNLTFVTGDRLEDAYETCQAIVRVLEDNATYVSLNPMCEPQLGKRGLYSAIGGAGERRDREMSLLWVLNLADGLHSLLDIAERSAMPFEQIRSAAALLEQHGLIRQVKKAEGDASGRLEKTSGA
jgi:aminopeptidase-like protein